MKLIKDVKEILNIFEKNGYKAYVVGGAVRNYVLNIKVEDYDITTDAHPNEVEKIFEKIVPTGIDFGTVTLIYKGNTYEVTTFRKDFLYSKNRKPKKIIYTEDINEDIKRRDFTINSLYCDIHGNIHDNFNGIDDINSKIIRTIGNPDKRFQEDALRMIRAIRFMSKLNFNIEQKTLESIKRNSELINNISKERINDEFNQILLSQNPSNGIRTLVNTNLMKAIIPEIYSTIDFEQYNKHHDKDVYEHTLSVLDNIEADLKLRLAALLHDIEKPKCLTIDEDGEGHFKGHHIKSAEKSVEILKRLKYDNKTIEDVRVLIRYHYLKDISIKDKGVKRFIKNVGKERLEDIFKLNIADIKGKATIDSIEKVYSLKEKCNNILERNEPITVKDLKINGNDIKEIGIKEGPKIGEILNFLLDIVIENPKLNQKDVLIKKTKEYFGKDGESFK